MTGDGEPFLAAGGERAKQCANHPTEAAVAACGSCRRSLCGACWRRNVDERPWCELCIHHVTATGRYLPVAAIFALLAGSFMTVGWRWEWAQWHEHHGFFWLCFLIAAGAAVYFAGTGEQRRPTRIVRERREDELPGAPAGGHRYRAVAFRASRFVASPLSGVWTAAVLLGSMLAVAVAVPELLHLPRWVEAEGVVLVWWILWAVTLSVLLYRGFRLSDDHVLAPPRFPWTSGEENAGRRRSGGWSGGSSGCDPSFDAEGCGEGLLAIVAAVVLFLAAWLVVDLVLPALFFLAYTLVRTSVARVANDDHGCEGRFDGAVGWGTLWATGYAIPLALAVAAVHAFVRSR